MLVCVACVHVCYIASGNAMQACMQSFFFIAIVSIQDLHAIVTTNATAGARAKARAGARARARAKKQS